MSRIIVCCAIAALLLGLSLASAQENDPLPIPPAPPAPGQLVDVGGYSLHIDCRGTGSPTVILEPGFARFSLNQRALQEQLALTTRVCVYDHAGFGWSEAGPSPRTTDQLVSELALLLQNAAVDGPYVLVGHSLGGFVARLFASRYPEQVSGVMLVEATPPDFLKQVTEAQTSPDGLELALRAALQTAQDGTWTTQSLLPILSLTDDVAPDQRETFIALATAPSYLEAALSEWENRLVNADEAAEAGLPDDMPLVTLVGGERLTRLNAEDLLWLPAQLRQSQLTANSQFVVAQRATHSIALEQPQAIVDALHWIMAQAA